MEEEDYLKTWFTYRNLSLGTRRIYESIIKKYKEYTGKSFEELISEAEQEEEGGVRLRKRQITGYIVGFKSELEEKGRAPGTVNNHISAIMSFYKAFDIQTPNIILPDGDIGLEKNHGRLLTREEIKTMIDVANVRDKALIYLLALTGMSQAEARNLTVKKFLDSCSEAIKKEIPDLDKLFEYEDKIIQEIIMLDIVRGKVHYRYQTFIPPEASKPIINYIRARQLHENKKMHIKDLNGPLFITKTGKPMSRTGVGNEIKRVGKLAGFKTEGDGTYCYWRPHAMRKYFISTIINSIGDHILADYLAGHKIPAIKRAYWMAGPEDLKKKYMEALPYLSIDKIKVKDIESKEYQSLMEKLDEKNLETTGLHKEVDNLKTQVNLMGELMNKKEFLDKLKTTN